MAGGERTVAEEEGPQPMTPDMGAGAESECLLRLVALVWAIVDVVSAEAERLLEALLLLPHHEQVQLMTVLADSVEGDDETGEVDVAWIKEAKRRLAGIRAGERIPVSWEAVEARLLSE